MMPIYINVERIGIHGDVESTVKALLSGEGGELEREGRSKRIIHLPGQPVANITECERPVPFVRLMCAQGAERQRHGYGSRNAC